MDLPPQTYMVDVPYEQREAVVSSAAGEMVASEITHLDEAESGVRAYRVYIDPPPNMTHLSLIQPVPIVAQEEVSANINTERLELLAEKYVGNKWFREMDARLQIDHKKIEMLYPRVTPEQITIVDETRERFRESGEQISQMLDDLGID